MSPPFSSTTLFSVLSKFSFSNLSHPLPLTCTFFPSLRPADRRLPALPGAPVFRAFAEWGSGPHAGWTGGSCCGGPGARTTAQVTTPPSPLACPLCLIHQAAPSFVFPAGGQKPVLSPSCTLRTLPVLKVNMTMKFTPPEVTKAVYQCWDELTTTVEAGQATVCLTIHKSSQDHLGELPPGRPDPYLPEAPYPALSSGPNGARNPDLTSTSTQLPFSLPLPTPRPLGSFSRIHGRSALFSTFPEDKPSPSHPL